MRELLGEAAYCDRSWCYQSAKIEKNIHFTDSIRFTLIYLNVIAKLLLQLKPLNVITFGMIETDNINRMIAIT